MTSAPRDGFTETNGIILHYRDWGGSGRPVVLLHGLASNARIWDFTAPLLAQTARVIALDQRGHGQSARPEHGYGNDVAAADLAGVIDALRLEAPLIVGHSWGANVAVCYAATSPRPPAGVALVDGGTFNLTNDPGMTRDEARRTLTPPRIAGTPRTRFLELVRRGDLAELWTPEIEAIFMAQFHVAEDDTVAPHLTFERHMQIVDAILDYFPEEMLPRVLCPVLLLPCVRDPSSEWVERKRRGVAAAERLAPRARTVWLDGAIHDVPLQQPQRLAGVLLDFLRDLDGAPK